MADSYKFEVLDPELQVSFYYRLKLIREEYLDDALSKTIQEFDISIIDKELKKYVPKSSLTKLASVGLRGELVFPVPVVLEKNPFLLGYYRLLLGFSQKEFYSKGPFGRFKAMEDKGKLSKTAGNQLEDLCLSLIQTSCKLIDEIDPMTHSIIHDLQLLTIGPQLRGSKNNEFGKIATQKTFDLIKAIVKPYIKSTTPISINIVNDSSRTVRIEFAADPDIQIIEELKSGERGLVSIEIKGGRDVSNIHNRIGEAEKSHQKAKKKGYYEFMTILSVDIDYDTLKEESPTTSHFFHLDRLIDKESNEFNQFRDLISSMLSINV
ncbi:MAG: XcyI family restriction endonuclease [Flavobacteriales bacterium]|nr:XcyI family restriction endonuclease [Flavobacteriales bacterium]